jgi:tetratricopeptide (TPR) repeat protein
MLGKALELDEELSEAHAARALLAWRYEWDWAAAERGLDHAIALDASYECVRAYHAYYLAWRGRRAEALSEMTKGRELSPSSSYATAESSVYFLLGDYPRLVEASRKGVISDPNEWLERYFLGVGYEGVGMRAEAIPEFEQAVKMSGGDQDPRAALAHAYAVVGKRAEAETILRDLLRRSADEYVSPYMIGAIYAGLGNNDKAFEFLDKALQERCLDLVWNLRVDPRLDTLRSDPRFLALCERIGFPE